MNTFQIVLLAVILFVVVSLVWRLVSNRKSLPCPSWLGFRFATGRAGPETPD